MKTTQQIHSEIVRNVALIGLLDAEIEAERNLLEQCADRLRTLRSEVVRGTSSILHLVPSSEEK